MGLIDSLTKLYEVDRQLRGLRSRLQSARTYRSAQEHQLDEARQQLQELETRRRQIKAKIANLEVEGGSLDQQLEKYRSDLNSAATNKQYSAVLSELNTVKEARSKLDDSILAEMGEVEKLDGQIEEANARCAERQKLLDIADARLRERETDVAAHMAELEAQRDAAAGEIPPAELRVFDEMADVHDGEAMAPVLEIDRRHREYSCGECNIQLPFEKVAVLMSPSGGLVRCTACGRILFLQESVRGALEPK